MPLSRKKKLTYHNSSSAKWSLRFRPHARPASVRPRLAEEGGVPPETVRTPKVLIRPRFLQGVGKFSKGVGGEGLSFPFPLVLSLSLVYLSFSWEEKRRREIALQEEKEAALCEANGEEVLASLGEMLASLGEMSRTEQSCCVRKSLDVTPHTTLT